MNKADFNRLLSKGEVGVSLVKKYFEQKGYVVYTTSSNKKEYFDMIITSSKNKGEITRFIVEVKTVNRRIKYADTGLSNYDIEGYLKVQEAFNCKMMIAFVDESLDKIYGASLDELLLTHIDNGISYPWICGGQRIFDGRTNEVIYFPLSIMRDIAVISELKDK